MASDKLYADSGNISSPARAAMREIDLDKLAEQLTKFRLDHDITFEQLAARTRVSKSTLQRFESGSRKLNGRTIRKLQRFLEAILAA